MKIAIFLLFGLLAAPSPVKPNAYKAQRQPDNSNKGDVITVNNRTSPAEPPHQQKEAPKWYASIQWSNWALVGVGIVTFIAIWRQVKHAAIAAEAARLNAQALLDSERPWMAVEPVERKPSLGYIPGPGDPMGCDFRNVFAVRMQNIGKTPARVLRTAMEYVYLQNLEQLPGEPIYRVIEPYTGEILFPNKEPIGRIAYLSPNAILSKEWIVAVENGKAFLYAYGFVEYEDTFELSRRHITQFGYVYNVPQGGQPQILRGFMPGGPKAYNRAT